MCQKHSVPCIVAIPTASSRPSLHRSQDSSSGIAGASGDASINNAAQYQALQPTSPQHFYTSPNQISVKSPATTIDQATTLEDVQFPPKAVCLHLATLYFDYVHDQLHTLFHKPSFMTGVAQGRTSPGLMFAVIALSAR